MSIIKSIDSHAGSTYISDEARKVLRNTYFLLALTMLPSIVGAVAGVIAPIVLYVGTWGFLGIFLVGMIGFQMAVVKNRDNVAGIYFLLGFSAFMGYMLGPLLSIALTFSNGVDLIAMAFGGTAATFFVLAGYASVTTRNFATPGIAKTLGIGILMAFVLSLVAFAFQIPALSMAISAVIIPIASCYIVMVINNIVRGGERNYIIATMQVYIMLFNIFQSLLHLLMAFAGNRD